nr:MAG TPA: hypothetical protein [Caudoviricetes sp.]
MSHSLFCYFKAHISTLHTGRITLSFHGLKFNHGL